MDLKNFYKHIKMCLNAVTRLWEDFINGYQYINKNSEFSEYFIPNSDHPSYSWNVHIYTSIGHSLVMSMTNDTCLKSSMTPQAYKVVSTHANKISGWKILSRLIHNVPLILELSEMFYYISIGTSLLFSRLPFQHHLIRCPQILCWIPKVCSWNSLTLWFCWPSRFFLKSPYKTQNNLDYIQIKIFRVNPHREKNIVVPTGFSLSKQKLSLIIHQLFGHVSITRLKLMAKKGLIEGLP